MSLSAAVVSILTSAVITLGLRAFPFLVFGKQRRMPDKLARLGDMLPSAIMAVLVIYCLKDVGSDLRGIAFPKGIAVVVVAVSYKWKHNTLISIAVGTSRYMVLLRVL